ncbi:MAG: AAA family ATPase [Acidobacteria bacterium]|nr:MAG: AAA family ATPase [Acidobacteriota bacterium]
MRAPTSFSTDIHPVIDSAHPRMQKLASVVARIAPTDLSVLITGETGVGKEVLARQIHAASLRREQPLVKINSAAIPETLIESELFGYQTGAFTGAERNRPGRIQEAHRGTLFFDEIGELTVEAQAKLLHMLQDGEFHSLGSNQTTRVDVRVIAATNRDLYEEIQRGTFREDLFYRLNVVHIEIPPLRERVKDTRGLTDHFLQLYASEFNRPAPPVLRTEHYEALEAYRWPGNVRELENFIKSLVLFNDPRSSFSKLKERARESAHQDPSQLSLVQMARLAGLEAERRVIEYTLRSNGWNRKRTAKILRISYRSLLSKIKKMEID